MEPPQISFFAHYMGASSGKFLRLLYVEAPLDNFLRLLYGAPLRSVSSLTIWGPPQINFFASNVRASSDQFLRILYKGPLRSFSSPIGGPQVIFFAYRGPSVQFLCILYWAPLRLISSLTIWGPLGSISSHTIWEPPQTCFFASYMRAPLRSVSSLTKWGGPSGQFLHLLHVYGGPLG